MNNFSEQIEVVTNHIHVVGGKEIYLLSHRDERPSTPNNDDVESALAKFGISIDISDIKSLLALHIYFNYYVWPPEKLAERKLQILAKQSKELVPVNEITYEDATGLLTDYWIDTHWNYARPESDHKYPTTQVLRKGSEGHWVGNSEYVEASLISSDDDPTLHIHQRTHAFAFGSRISIYNWIYGKHLSDDDNKGTARFYFHLTPYRESAALLTREIQKGFDLYEIPFTFKFLAFDEDYQHRSDTAVLYVLRKHLHVVMHLLANIYNLLGKTSLKDLNSTPILEPETPRFAYRLADGIAFAENPENNDSFGMSRCKLLAEALIAKDFEKGDDRIKQVKLFIEDKQRGFLVDDFYKNPHSPTDYRFFFELFKCLINRFKPLSCLTHLKNNYSDDPKQQDVSFKTQPDACAKSLKWNAYRRIKIRLSDEAEWFGQPGVYRRKYLIAAVRIAIRLCKEAVWYPENLSDQTGKTCWKCNWLSYQPFETNESPKTGYRYQMLPTSGGADVGSESVKKFLDTIYENYYESDLFLYTSSFTQSESLLTESSVKPFNWEDGDIKLAWDYLYNKVELPKEQAERLADFVIERFIDTDRPLGNGYESKDPKTRELFCASKRFGLAGLGQFFLKIYEL